jgi:type I restriction enzyme S subunit
MEVETMKSEVGMNEKWGYIKFGDLFDYENKSKIKAGDGLNEGEYPFYTSSVELTKYINESQFDNTSLVFGTGGNASIHYVDKPFSVSTDCLVAFAKDTVKVYPKFVYYYISGNINLLDEGFKGAGLKHISKGYINEILIPLPPLATQKRIAEILDAADALRLKDQKLLKKYDELAQAIFIDMFGDPVKNEKGWEVKTVSDCIDFMTSGSRGWAQYYSEKGDIFLRINNVGYNELKLRDLMYVKAPFNAEAKRTQVQSGDLLMSITADLGRTCVVPKDFPRAFINQHLAILRLKADFEPDFVSQLFATDYGKNQFKMLNKGGVKAGLNFEDIKSLKFINPPKILQSKYAALLDKLRKMEVQNMFELEKSGRLFECLIQKAFKGELVS